MRKKDFSNQPLLSFFFYLGEYQESRKGTDPKQIVMFIGLFSHSNNKSGNSCYIRGELDLIK